MKLKLKDKEVDVLLKLLQSALSHRRFDSGVIYSEYQDDTNFVERIIIQVNRIDNKKKV